MKVILSCGGTGGHIYPALAIADTIRYHHPDAEIRFIGTQKGMENEIVPAHGYAIESIAASGWKRKEVWKNLQTIRDALQGYRQAKNIIRRFRPDLVVGTGGYVCGPVVRAAHGMGIPTAIHEQNAFPGMANKMLAKSVDRIFISFDEAREFFKRKDGILLVGNPLRRGFEVNDKNECRKKLNMPSQSMAVLCFGGSLGAARLSELMRNVMVAFQGSERVELYFVTGKHHYDAFVRQWQEEFGAWQDNIHVFEYLGNMPEYMTAADVIISRAGALTVAELTACGKPAILIPSPYVTGNHQYFNAKVMADQGAAILIEEKNLKDEDVVAILNELSNHPDQIDAMERASRRLGRTDAAEKIYNELMTLLEL